VEDNNGDSFRETLNELNAILRDPNIEPTTRYMLVLSKAAIEQSRLTYEGRKSQERLVQNLVFATMATTRVAMTSARATTACGFGVKFRQSRCDADPAGIRQPTSRGIRRRTGSPLCRGSSRIVEGVSLPASLVP
jgi:hypothetical protein